MRKIFCMLLCVCLVATMALTAFAASASVTTTVSSETVSKGATFTVVTELTNTDKIKLGSVALEYDANVFEMTGGECHVSGADIGTVLADQKAGTFLIMDGAKVSGKLFTFEMKVNSAAATGEYTIQVKAAIGTKEGEEIEANSVKVKVTADGGNTTEATTPEETVAAETTPETAAPEASMPVATAPEETTAETIAEETTEQTPPETTTPEDSGTVATYPYDEELQKKQEVTTTGAGPKTSTGAWVAVVIVLVAGAAVAAVLWFRKKKQ